MDGFMSLLSSQGFCHAFGLREPKPPTGPSPTHKPMVKRAFLVVGPARRGVRQR